MPNQDHLFSPIKVDNWSKDQPRWRLPVFWTDALPLCPWRIHAGPTTPIPHQDGVALVVHAATERATLF